MLKANSVYNVRGQSAMLVVGVFNLGEAPHSALCLGVEEREKDQAIRSRREQAHFDSPPFF